jgi:hypothetical protein
LVGVARDSGAFLAYLGSIQKPLPNWQDGSPLDEPDRTAECLLRRYHELGRGFLVGVFGQYVVVVGDEHTGQTWVACDPGGLRRAFYRLDGSNLAFATNLVSLAGAFPGNFSLDRGVEDFLLGYEFVPPPRTLFKNVVYLPPRGLLNFTHEQMSVQTTPAVDLDAGEYQPLSAEEQDLNAASDRLARAFVRAVSEQTTSASRVAVLLGGFDSALVAAALVRLGKQVETFTFKFRDYPHNQGFTEELAHVLGSQHVDVIISPDELGKVLEEYASTFNQPVSQAHYVIHTLLALREMRARGHTHALSGDGCDEAFLGYPMVHRRAKLFQQLGVLPQPMVRGARALLGWSVLEDVCGHPCRLARNTLTVMGRRMPTRGHIAQRVFDDLSLARLRLEPPPPQERDCEAILDELAARHAGVDPVRLAFFGKSSVGVNRNRNEGATAASGVGILSPYQHPGLKQLVGSMPQQLLRPPDASREVAGRGKYVLLHMAEASGLLPRSIVYQPKASPVTAPVDYWYMGELRQTLERLVGHLPFRYSQAYISHLLKPKIAEEVFRRYGGIGRYASHAMSMLVTYASFARFADG